MIVVLLKRLLLWIWAKIYEFQIGTALEIQVLWSLVGKTSEQIQLEVLTHVDQWQSGFTFKWA